MKSSRNKVVAADFTPRTLHLANASRDQMRIALTYRTPFPDSTLSAKIQYTWDEICLCAVESQDKSIKDSLTRAQRAVKVKQRLVTYVSL